MPPPMVPAGRKRPDEAPRGRSELPSGDPQRRSFDLRVADLIAYKQKDEAHRKGILPELTAEAEKHGLGY